jgi:N-acetylmuramic acid 6-phosphate (MurNAc-6-P) etherase
MENKLENALNLEPIPAEKVEVLPPVSVVKKQETPIDDEAEADFQEARRNIRQIIGDGQQALSGILSLADASEHPRTFEVAGQIIKTLVDANKDLLGLHKQKKELKKVSKDDESNGESPKQVTNNAYFVGTAADLQAIVNKRRNGTDD